jgi:hypothetical protein
MLRRHTLGSLSPEEAKIDTMPMIAAGCKGFLNERTIEGHAVRARRQ